MIWSYLEAIGRCVPGVESTGSAGINIPVELAEHIKNAYPEPPGSNQVLVVTIPVDAFTNRLDALIEIINQKSSSIEKTYNSIDLHKAKKEAAEILPKIIEDILSNVPNSLYDDLANLITTEIVDYSEEIMFKILRGDDRGNNVFKSITHFTKGKPKVGLTELPLWKIRLKQQAWSTPSISRFINYIPNNTETREIDWAEGGMALFKLVFSDILCKVINKSIASLSLIAKSYPVCFKLDGKWPAEYPEFVQYYLAQITSTSIGTCSICGREDVSIEELPTKQIGFFSDDQWSTQLKFTSDAPMICINCSTNVKKGYNYVKKNLRFFISSRGKKNNPFEMYILPYSPDNSIVKSVLQDIEEIRATITAKAKEGMAGAISRARIATVLEKREKPAEKKEDENEANAEKSETMDYFDALLQPSTIDDAKAALLSFMIVIFTHPEGNASDFHNVLDIILADGISLKRLGLAIKHVTNRYNVQPSILRRLYNVIGRFYYPKFLGDLIRLVPIDREQFFRNGYLNTKQAFLQSIKGPSREHQGAGGTRGARNWIGQDLFILDIANSLMEELKLWQ
nr:TM1802 family CRISPR-associated protein [Candidatus Sigynarchaeota archaeon]